MNEKVWIGRWKTGDKYITEAPEVATSQPEALEALRRRIVAARPGIELCVDAAVGNTWLSGTKSGGVALAGHVFVTSRALAISWGLLKGSGRR
jgi:hypothetical protein